MKGLIIKDILFLKGYIKTIGIMLIIFTVMGMTTNNLGVPFYITFIAIMVSLSTFSYDEFNKWDTYVLSLPVSRSDVVKAKYLFTLLMIALATVMGLVLTFVIMALKGKYQIEALPQQILGSLLSISVVIMMLYPFIYKFGSEKGRISFFVFLLGTLAIIGALVFGLGLLGIQMDLNQITLFIKQYGLYLGSGFAIIGLYISYQVSVYMYKKRAF